MCYQQKQILMSDRKFIMGKKGERYATDRGEILVAVKLKHTRWKCVTFSTPLQRHVCYHVTTWNTTNLLPHYRTKTVDSKCHQNLWQMIAALASRLSARKVKLLLRAIVVSTSVRHKIMKYFSTRRYKFSGWCHMLTRIATIKFSFQRILAANNSLVTDD